jgi:signal transduction histidine kinase
MHQVGVGLQFDRPNLTRLRVAGIAIPLLAIIAGETFRYFVPGGESDMIVHLLWGAAAGIGVLLFALSMFWSIGRAEQAMVQQNRELGAVNAVSTAVQDALSSQALVAAAVRSIVDATGAVRASVQLFPEGTTPGTEPTVFERPGDLTHPDGLPVELPLTTGSAVVGLLRVWLPPDPDAAISAPAMQNISHQLGCAIQLHRVVEDLRRRQAETNALYELAIQISDQRPLADTLAQVTRSVRQLLGADEVAVCLTPAVSASVLTSHEADGAAAPPPQLDEQGTICLTASAGELVAPHRAEVICPVRSSPQYRQALDAPIRSADVTLGDIWAARTDDRPFGPAERATLQGLADISAIAITSAQLRYRERISAMVAERERIARELHDSLAQVLGVTHLRLRAVREDPMVRESPVASREIEELADLAQEAFHDVREAILGLREASNVGKGFLPGLAAYLEKFGRQSRIAVKLDTQPGIDPELGPHAEIQVIRVIQEALANVRKHAEALQATVRVTEDASATVIEVEDDGRGFDVNQAIERDGGYGLLTMRERLQLVGGSFSVDSAIGRGTRIVARIPRDPRRGQQQGGARGAEATASSPAGR